MTLKNAKEEFYYRVWLGVSARVDAIGHWLQGHDVRWWQDPEIWGGCFGHISCNNCPDASEGSTGITFWCRHTFWFQSIMQFVCSLFGHTTNINRSGRLIQIDPTNEDSEWGFVSDPDGEPYCYRCGGHMSEEAFRELMDELHEEALQEK